MRFLMLPYGSARRLVLAVALFTPHLAGQRPIFVVDEQGGAGSHFTDLPAAVAAVPDGSVLIVRSGLYRPFTVAGKGLSIVGEDAAQVRVGVGGALSISATSSTQHFLLRNLEITAVAVSLRNAQGVIVLDRVTTGFALFDTTGFVIDQCSNVQFHRCVYDSGGSIVGNSSRAPRVRVTDSALHVGLSTIEGAKGGGWGVQGNAALSLTRSRCVAVESTLRGGEGGEGCNMLPCYAPNGIGGTGVEVSDQSTFISLRTPVRGGAEGKCSTISPCPGSRGGDGIVLTNGSVGYFEGAAPAGGLGGRIGSAQKVSSGSVLQINATSVPSTGDLSGQQAVGQVVRFGLQARPGSLAVLLFATQPTLIPLEPLTPGSFLVAQVLSIGPLSVPASGQTEWGFAIPASYPLGETYYWQFLTLEPGNTALWATNPFSLHVNQ